MNIIFKGCCFALVCSLSFTNLLSMQTKSAEELDKLQHKIEEMKIEQILKLLIEFKNIEDLSRINKMFGAQDFLKNFWFFWFSSVITIAATIVAVNNGTMDQIAGTKIMDQFVNGITGRRLGTMQAGFKNEKFGSDTNGDNLAQICATCLYVIGIWGGTFVLFKFLDVLIGKLRGDFVVDKEGAKKLARVEKLLRQIQDIQNLKNLCLNQQVQNTAAA